MTKAKKRVGLYGGTFSPPHLGHLHAAKSFAEALGLDSLVIMPAGIPPHKKVEHYVDGETRLEMCRLTFGEIEGAHISDFEIKKEGKSYTVETLRHMKSEDSELYMLCGDDMFLTLDTWRCAAEIFSLTNIVCMRRYRTDIEELLRKKAEYEEKYGARVIFIDAAAYPASSTEIREKLKSGESCTGLLEPRTESFIRKRDIYPNEDSEKVKKEIREEDILSLREKVRGYLTEKRYAHTLAVERKAEELGELYLPEKVGELRCSALLHDITKKWDFEKQLQYCEKFDIMMGRYDILSPKLFHAKTAENVVKCDFSEFATPDVLSGIRWHTTGHDDMTLFEAIVYLADYIEDTRTFPDCVVLREFFEEGLRRGDDREELFIRTMVKSFDMTIKCLTDEGAPIDTDTVTARSFYINKLCKRNK